MAQFPFTASSFVHFEAPWRNVRAEKKENCIAQESRLDGVSTKTQGRSDNTYIVDKVGRQADSGPNFEYGEMERVQ